MGLIVMFLFVRKPWFWLLRGFVCQLFVGWNFVVDLLDAFDDVEVALFGFLVLSVLQFWQCVVCGQWGVLSRFVCAVIGLLVMLCCSGC